MNEMDIVRKITQLFYAFRKDNFLNNERKSKFKLKHRDIMILDAIMRINHGDLIKMSDLSDYFAVTPAAISQIIKQFEKEGWIERIHLESDRRSVYIRVNDEAQQMLKNCEDFMTKHLVDFIEYLGEEDANALVRIIEKAFTYANNRKQQNKEEL